MRISKTLWQGALLALVTCGPAASLAQDAVEADAATAEASTEATGSDAAPAKKPKSEAEKAPARPFIERSLVIAPEQVGKFKLVSINDYPGNPASGVGVRYQHAEFPDVRVDLFVYPAGRVDRDEVLTSAMLEVRMALEEAVEKGSYSNLEMDEVVEFDLGRVDADGSLLPPPEPARPGKRASDEQALLSAVAQGQAYRVGRLLEARFTVRDEALDSRAYLFYRGLYLIKGRISGSPITLPREAFDRFTHHAMATLVPALATRSTGGCFQHDITIDPNAGDIAEAIVASAARGVEEQCGKTLDDSIPADHRAMPLVYDPGMWSSDG